MGTMRTYLEIDECLIIECFIRRDRKEVIDDLLLAVEYTSDEEMKETCIGIIEKLNRMTDEEFNETDFKVI